jgi:cyclohexyl-isocyanide hydratase
MQIAALVFPDMDQMDLTGPFEVLSRLPDAEVHPVWKELTPVRDALGLMLTPNATIVSDLPHLDVLLVPGGRGQLPLTDDEAILSWVRARAAEARYILSVCTGALTLGAAGVLQGRRASSLPSAQRTGFGWPVSRRLEARRVEGGPVRTGRRPTWS